MKQFITRKGSIDCGHRVMHHAFACNNYHGHTYLYELSFGFENTEAIGYAIDFKEIKRIGVNWLLDFLDHGFVANPDDTEVIKLVNSCNMKLWIMSIAGTGKFCNPTVENMAKEIFLAMELLFDHIPGLSMHELVLYETPNNFTTCYYNSISTIERNNFHNVHKENIIDYVRDKGNIGYDVRNGGETTSNTCGRHDG